MRAWGVIDADAFLAARGEIFLTLSKVQSFLSELRRVAEEPEFCKHIEMVVMAAPDAKAILARRRAAARAASAARQA